MRDGLVESVAALRRRPDAGLVASVNDGIISVPHDLAVVLLGGLRELTASVVERDGDLREIADTATAAALALVGSTRADRAPGRSSP